MNLEQQVLPGDLTDAERERACLSNCLFLASRAVINGNFEASGQLLKDCAKSQKELERLIQYNREFIGEWLTKEAIEAYEKQMIGVKADG